MSMSTNTWVHYIPDAGIDFGTSLAVTSRPWVDTHFLLHSDRVGEWKKIVPAQNFSPQGLLILQIFFFSLWTPQAEWHLAPLYSREGRHLCSQNLQNSATHIKKARWINRITGQRKKYFSDIFYYVSICVLGANCSFKPCITGLPHTSLQ